VASEAKTWTPKLRLSREQQDDKQALEDEINFAKKELTEAAEDADKKSAAEKALAAKEAELATLVAGFEARPARAAPRSRRARPARARSRKHRQDARPERRCASPPTGNPKPEATASATSDSRRGSVAAEAPRALLHCVGCSAARSIGEYSARGHHFLALRVGCAMRPRPSPRPRPRSRPRRARARRCARAYACRRIASECCAFALLTRVSPGAGGCAAAGARGRRQAPQRAPRGARPAGGRRPARRRRRRLQQRPRRWRRRRRSAGG